MIGMLSGTCLMAGTGEAIIDVAGVGYLVQCGSRCLSAMHEGQPTRVHIETHVREQAITLYGFPNEEERAWFVRLQSVQGVGPKAALAILDILAPGQILSAASLEDKAAFARASGVGPKLAARLAIELSGKPAPIGRGYARIFTQDEHCDDHRSDVTDIAATDMATRSDAVSALVNLGVGQSEALKAVAKAYSDMGQDERDEGAKLDDLIKLALKELSA